MLKCLTVKMTLGAVIGVMLALFNSAGASAGWLDGRSSSYDAMEERFSQELFSRVESASTIQVDNQEDESEWKFTRFQILTGAFAEFDLKVLELKVHPYVELRFNRK
jgi:hypothetical protein